MTKPVNKAPQFTWNKAALDAVHESIHRRIVVLGVGNAGNNIISRLVEKGVDGAGCVAINTDVQHLNATKATCKVLIGEKTTKGLGAGGDPEIGRVAVEDSRKKIEKIFTDIDVAFITTGLGGGTGTGAAPVVAEIARISGTLVVGVVTTPFRIERGRIECAAKGLNKMRRECDTMVVVDNNKFTELVPKLPMSEAFKVADQVLANMIKGVVETISAPSLINLDFADFKAIARNGGVAVVGVGESDAANRVEDAVRNAFRSPLLDVDYEEATGALINVTGGEQMTIEEANRVGEIVSEMMPNNTRVIWGARANPSLAGILRVTLVMTGVDSSHILSGFGMRELQLFDLDSCSEPEESLSIDLGLDQIEDFE